MVANFKVGYVQVTLADSGRYVVSGSTATGVAVSLLTTNPALFPVGAVVSAWGKGVSLPSVRVFNSLEGVSVNGVRVNP